jgi:hypothetical protein
MKLYDIITRAERDVLREHCGNTIEAQSVRAKLHAAGLRHCRGCGRVKGVRRFAKQARERDGLAYLCKPCSYRDRHGKLVRREPYKRPPAEVVADRKTRNGYRYFAKLRACRDSLGALGVDLRGNWLDRPAAKP